MYSDGIEKGRMRDFEGLLRNCDMSDEFSDEIDSRHVLVLFKAFSPYSSIFSEVPLLKLLVTRKDCSARPRAATLHKLIFVLSA